MKRKNVLPSIVLCLLLISCSKSYHHFVSAYTFSSNKGVPDYGNLDYWAAHPDKRDPSDSVPRPLRKAYHPDSTVDVFFIYPTTYTDPQKALGWNAPIDDANLNAKTDYTTILFQASIFNEAGRVFSPRYRQANYYCYFPKTASDSASALIAFELAYQDIKAAFLYYLEHNNKGRPIIIASHSQGTTHAKRLLKEFFDGKPLQKSLVAAYLVGMPVEQDYFNTIKPCNIPTQTGCFTSWRTFKQGYTPEYVQQEKFTAIVTNPLSWDTAKPNVTRDQNKGGVLLNFNRIVKKVAKADISGNILWIDKPHFFGNQFYTTKVYHVADLNLYYLSIRENVRGRVNAYQKK
jgi:hypothetical protein